MESVRFNGALLRRLRQERGWSQSDVAKRAGLSVSHVSQLEKASRKSPSVDLVYRIASVFGVSMYQFLCPAGDLDAAADPAFASVYGSASRTSDATAWPGHVAERLATWSRELPPDVLSFVLGEQSAEYVQFAKRLHDHRRSPRDVLQLVHDFLAQSDAETKEE